LTTIRDGKYHFLGKGGVVVKRNGTFQTTSKRKFLSTIGTCPPGHVGAGGKAWLFADEIIVD
jgi:hypothetical protein